MNKEGRKEGRKVERKRGMNEGTYTRFGPILEILTKV
jgi:hypothetical protein